MSSDSKVHVVNAEPVKRVLQFHATWFFWVVLDGTELPPGTSRPEISTVRLGLGGITTVEESVKSIAAQALNGLILDLVFENRVPYICASCSFDGMVVQ